MKLMETHHDSGGAAIEGLVEQILNVTKQTAAEETRVQQTLASNQEELRNISQVIK